MPTTYTLKPHVDNPPVDLSVAVSMSRPQKSKWMLVYELVGRIDSIIIPNESLFGNGRNLWEETCFEFFVRHPDGEYLEFNFSPTGKWSCFSFSSYRCGMTDLELRNDPKSVVKSHAEKYRFEVSLDLDGIGLKKYSEPELVIAITSVLKMRDQRYCYYALDFADGQPDFHDMAGFRAI